MADEVTTTESTSWGSKLKGSIGGAVFGILLFLGSFGLLWWNEGRTVHTEGALKKAGKEIVLLQSPVLNTANENKLIHLSGNALTKEPARDASFGINPDALRVTRTVEMYQWIEKQETKEKEKVGGGTEKVTTYRYEKTWHEGRVNSSKFKEVAGHENPEAPFASATLSAAQVKVGDFVLGEAFHGSLGPDQSFTLTESNLAALPTALKAMGPRLSEGRVVTGDALAPKLGDLRMAWTYVPNNLPVSVAAEQNGGSLGRHLINDIDVSRIAMGTVSAKAIYAKAQSSNKTMAWILRLVGFLMMWSGLRMVLAPIAMLLAFLPFLKKLAEVGIGVVTFLIAVFFSLITIAIAWFFYRPALSIALLAIAAGAVYGIIWYRKRKKLQVAKA